MTDINVDELIAEARSLSTYEGSTLERAADALERLRVERDEWRASANEWADALADAADELNEALAVIERIGAMAENDDAAAWDAHQELIRLVARSAPADALREHDAALIESLAGGLDEACQSLPHWPGATHAQLLIKHYVEGVIDSIEYLREKARERREGVS